MNQFLTLLAATALAAGGIAAAADYPDHPLSVMVAYSPGGATDLQARSEFNTVNDLLD